MTDAPSGGARPRPPVVLIVPTRNEAESLGAALAGVPRRLVDRIIVADGGSSDSTATVARTAGAEVLDAGPGYGRACWSGALAATADAILVFMDGDGSDRADLIGTLVEPLVANQADFVLASRLDGAREPGSMGPHQIVAGLLAGRVIEWLYDVRYRDMCAFRAIRRADLLRLGMKEMSYGWNLEMQIRAAKARLRILEVPLPYGKRIGGRSKVSGRFFASLGVGARLVSTFIRVARE